MLLPQSHFPSNKRKSKSERSVTTMIGVVKSMIGLLVDEAHLCNRLSRPSVKRPKIGDFHSAIVLNKQSTNANESFLACTHCKITGYECKPVKIE